MVKNLPANAGDISSIPGVGRSYMLWDNKAYVPQLLSTHITTTEACMPGAHVCNMRSHDNEKHRPCN